MAEDKLVGRGTHACVIGLLLITVAVLITGCGGSSGLSASSTCGDFSEASPQTQMEAISKLASEYEAPELTTPLGEPDVGYACASDPEMTLGTFFERFQHNGEE
jgi:hypothetical protein